MIGVMFLAMVGRSPTRFALKLNALGIKNAVMIR